MSKQTNPVENFIVRYNFVIITVISAIVLGASIYLSYTTFISSSSSDDASVQSTIPTTFDPATSKRIDSLNTSDTIGKDPMQPEGRINPFSE